MAGASPSHQVAGQVLKKTGRHRLTLSTAVPLQDRRTTLLRTLPAASVATPKRRDIIPAKDGTWE